MPRKRLRLSPEERLRRIASSGLYADEQLHPIAEGEDALPPVSERMEAVRLLFRRFEAQKITNMLFFVSYDIEDNRVRRHIAKYLLRKGCVRLQKSVYFGTAKRDQYQELVKTLAEVQALYQNHDSIFLLPVGEDNVHKMEVIGQNLNLQLHIDPGSVFFF